MRQVFGLFHGLRHKARRYRSLVTGLMAAALCCLSLGACGPQQSLPEPSPSPFVLQPDVTPYRPFIPDVPVVDLSPDLPSGINPLSGLPMDEAFAQRRPVAVMLNNLKQALPMFGISQADILYEAMAEGGITRLVGLYSDASQVPQIGTVRSTRLYYLDIAQGHDAILLHCGGSPEALDTIKSRGMLALDLLKGYEDTLYWRDKDRIKKVGLEHSAFTSGERIETVFAKLSSRINHEPGYRESLRFVADATPKDGDPAENISIKYSSYKTGIFAYNSDTGLYAVSQYGKPFIDAQTGDQLTTKNVLILKTSVSVIKGDKAGRLRTEMTGSGEGLFCCGGKMIPIRWAKKSPTDPYIYTTEDGLPLSLNTGHSYINIVSLETKIEIT